MPQSFYQWFQKHLITESFKTYIQNHGPQTKQIIDKFKDQRHTLKPPHNDISFWMNKTPNELYTFLQNIPQSKTQSKRNAKTLNIQDIKNDPNVDLLYHDNTQTIIGIRNYEGAQKWGSSTTHWCITKEPDAYNSHTKKGRFIFMFQHEFTPYNIHTDEGDPHSKLAILIDKKGIVSVHNATDTELTDYYDIEETIQSPSIQKWIKDILPPTPEEYIEQIKKAINSFKDTPEITIDKFDIYGTDNNARTNFSYTINIHTPFNTEHKEIGQYTKWGKEMKLAVESYFAQYFYSLDSILMGWDDGLITFHIEHVLINETYQEHLDEIIGYLDILKDIPEYTKQIDKFSRKILYNQ
jgi:hypothetical protein